MKFLKPSFLDLTNRKVILRIKKGYRERERERENRDCKFLGSAFLPLNRCGVAMATLPVSGSRCCQFAEGGVNGSVR